MDGLILGEDLKMTNIVNLTEKRIRRLTMQDLKEILSNIDEHDAKVMVNAIREGKYDKVAHVIEFVTYKTIQEKIK